MTNEQQPGTRDDRWHGPARMFSLAMVGAVLWPIVENWRTNPRDNFPLSYYPMFSGQRNARVSVTYLVGVDAHGRQRRLPYRVAGNGGLNQVRRQINWYVREGRVEMLGSLVLERLERWPSDRFDDVVDVRIVKGRFCLREYFGGNRKPKRERTLWVGRVGSRLR